MRHRFRFKQLAPPHPRQSLLRERLACGIEVASDGSRIRTSDAAGVRAEPFVPHRAEVLAVRVEDVLAPDVARGVEERDSGTERDLEDALPLAVRLPDERRVDGRELRRA